MGQVIYKYPLNIMDVQTVEMPEGARILSVANQRGTTCVWALVDPSRPLTRRRFYVVGTGRPVPENAEFVGSVIDEPFVWHLFQDPYDQMEDS